MCDLSLFSCVFDKPLLTGSLDYPVEPLSQKTVLPGAFTSECKPKLVPGHTEGDGGLYKQLQCISRVYLKVAVHLDQNRQHLLQTDGDHLLPRKDVYHGLAFSLAHRFSLHETTWLR